MGVFMERIRTGSYRSQQHSLRVTVLNGYGCNGDQSMRLVLWYARN